jgi:glyoxylase I family protein
VLALNEEVVIAHTAHKSLRPPRIPIGHHVWMVDDIDRPRQSGMSHFGLSVTDLDRSITFYCDVLGAMVVRTPYNGYRFSGRMALVTLGSTAVDLYEHAANEGERFEPARTGLDHLALVAASYEDLDAWGRWVDAKGVRRSEIREVEGAAIFDFVDPDGIQIEFCFVYHKKLASYVAE